MVVTVIEAGKPQPLSEPMNVTRFYIRANSGNSGSVYIDYEKGRPLPLLDPSRVETHSGPSLSGQNGIALAPGGEDYFGGSPHRWFIDGTTGDSVTLVLM